MKKIFVLLILFLFSGCVEQQISPIQTFEIDVSSTGLFNINDENITISVLVEDREITNWETSTLIFEITPNPVVDRPKEGDKIPFFFKTTFDARYFKYNDAYQLRWTYGNRLWYERGSISMSYLDEETLSLELFFNEYQLATTSQTTVTVTFHNIDHSWEKTYDINVNVI